MSRIRSRLYLLRLWSTSAHGEWRIMLENPTRGEQYGFGTPAEPADFLAAETSWRTRQSNRSGNQPDAQQVSTPNEGQKGQKDDFEDAQ